MLPDLKKRMYVSYTIFELSRRNKICHWSKLPVSVRTDR